MTNEKGDILAKLSVVIKDIEEEGGDLYGKGQEESLVAVLKEIKMLIATQLE